MIVPVQTGEALLADIEAARSDLQRLHLWWLGQSGFLLQWNSRHLLFDPYLSDSLTAKYASTDKPHVRMTERVVDPKQLGFVDVVTASHPHTDHLDGATLLSLFEANPKIEFIIPEAIRAFAVDRLRFPIEMPVGLVAGAAVSAGGFQIPAVPAAHEALDTDESGRHKYLGYVVEAGPWRVYHSGDTVLYPGMAELLRAFYVDVAILPINGRAAERRVAGNLNGREAAELGHAIGAKVVIPCHFEMFEFNTASPAEFIETATSLGQGYSVLRCGERWTVPFAPTERSCGA